MGTVDEHGDRGENSPETATVAGQHLPYDEVPVQRGLVLAGTALFIVGLATVVGGFGLGTDVGPHEAPGSLANDSRRTPSPVDSSTGTPESTPGGDGEVTSTNRSNGTVTPDGRSTPTGGQTPSGQETPTNGSTPSGTPTPTEDGIIVIG